MGKIALPRVIETVMTGSMAALLIGASQGHHSYGLYVLLRLATTIWAVYWAVRVLQEGPR
jgi:hypothetical protein